jgi:DNA-binding transcriptional ArsR family regulator
MQVAVQVLRDAHQAAALIDPARQSLLEKLHEPDSASGLARKLNLPRQQVNYHLRELEKRELVEFVEERRRGNCLERIMRATARQYVVSPDALGRLGSAAALGQGDRLSAAYLVSTAARIIRDLGVLGLRAARARKRLATLTLEAQIRFRSAEDRAEFAAELSESMARLAAKYHDETAPAGRTFHCLTGVYPAITKQEDDGSAPARME